jgi:hypothetical protein
MAPSLWHIMFYGTFAMAPSLWHIMTCIYLQQYCLWIVTWFCFGCLALQAWLIAFFAKSAGMKDPEAQVTVHQAPSYDVLTRSCTTMYLAFSYGPTVKLQIHLK